MPAKHWFYASTRESGGFQIETFGLGNHPRGVHWYETEEELNSAIKGFEAEGYENCTRKKI